MENWYPAVREYITAHREEIVSELMALCRIPSISQRRCFCGSAGPTRR